MAKTNQFGYPHFWQSILGRSCSISIPVNAMQAGLRERMVHDAELSTCQYNIMPSALKEDQSCRNEGIRVRVSLSRKTRTRKEGFDIKFLRQRRWDLRRRLESEQVPEESRPVCGGRLTIYGLLVFLKSMIRGLNR